MMIINFVLAGFLLFLAIIIYFAQGDGLIAGYNTASEEKRKKVDIRRIRLLTTTAILMAIVFLLVTPFIKNDDIIKVGVLIVIVAVTIIVILANTWAKKK